MDKTVIMFPGQASQYVGMGKTWFDKYEIVKRRLYQASEVLGWDLGRLCFYGPGNELTKTEHAQVAIVALSVAMFEVVVKEMGVVPDYLAGHSIGEISALTAAGVFTFTDAIKLAQVRGEAMASCNADKKGGMAAAVHIDVKELEKLLKEIDIDRYSVEIANYNTPTQTILSGSLEGLNTIGEMLMEHNARLLPLNVSGPFHSRFMAPAQRKLSEALENMELGSMSIPVLCSHKGKAYSKSDDIKASLVEQLISPVRWTQVISELNNLGTDRWLEVGPKDVLKKMILATIPEASVYSYDEQVPGEQTAKPSETNTLNPVGLCLGAAVATKNNNWDEEQYRKGVIEPYKVIQKLYKTLEEEKRQPSKEELGRSLNLLRSIFKTKGVPSEECIERYKKILRNTGFEQTFAMYIEGEDVHGYIPEQ